VVLVVVLFLHDVTTMAPTNINVARAKLSLNFFICLIFWFCLFDTQFSKRFNLGNKIFLSGAFLVVKYVHLSSIFTKNLHKTFFI
jgi:hypothetical protein